MSDIDLTNGEADAYARRFTEEVMRKTLLVAVAAALPLAAHAQETTLKLVSAFGETTTYVKHMTPWIQKFNAEGKALPKSISSADRRRSRPSRSAHR